MRFAKEHPSEILIIKIRFDDIDERQKEWADTVWHLLGERLLEAPDKGEPVPTYAQAVENNRNIILGSGVKKIEGHPVSPYYWPVGNNTPTWLGENSELLWNEPTWQSGDIHKVLQSTEEFIKKNQEHLAERKKFWLAQLQLTPVLGQSITTFFKDGGSVRPKDLALGGGIGTHGSFKGSNKEIRDAGIFKKPLWRKHASCLCYDFCDTETTGRIVAMNRKHMRAVLSMDILTAAFPVPDGNDDDDGPDEGQGHGEGAGRGGRGGGRGRGGEHGRGGRGRGHD